MSDWFEELLGFNERTPDEVREKLKLDVTRVRSKINSASYECGRLEVVSLQARVAAVLQSEGKLKVAKFRYGNFAVLLRAFLGAAFEYRLPSVTTVEGAR